MKKTKKNCEKYSSSFILSRFQMAEEEKPLPPKDKVEKPSGMVIIGNCFLEANTTGLAHSLVLTKLTEMAANRGYIAQHFSKPAMAAVAVFSFNLGFMNYMLTNRCQRMVLENSEDEQMRKQAQDMLFFQ